MKTFVLLLNFIIQEEVETETKRPVIILFRTNRYQYRQQQKSISDFDIYRYRYNNNNNNKRQSGSLFCLRERRLAHFVGINIMGGMGADCQQQQQQRKQIGNWNNNNIDDDCNATDSIDLQDKKHREIRKSMRFKTRTDKEKSNRLSTGSLTTRTTTTVMMIVKRPIRSTHSTYRLHVQIIMVKFTR